MSKDSKEVTLMSPAVNETVIRAAGALFSLVKSSTEVFPKISFDLPETYAECAAHQTREVLSRAYVALVKYDEAEQAQSLHECRGAVDAAIAAVKETNLAAQAQIMALPAAVRALIPTDSLKDWVGVPVSSLLASFPEGTDETRATSLLNSMGYKLVQGKSPKEGLRIRVTLREPVGPKPPTSGIGG